MATTLNSCCLPSCLPAPLPTATGTLNNNTCEQSLCLLPREQQDKLSSVKMGQL